MSQSSWHFLFWVGRFPGEGSSTLLSGRYLSLMICVMGAQHRANEGLISLYLILRHSFNPMFSVLWILLSTLADVSWSRNPVYFYQSFLTEIREAVVLLFKANCFISNSPVSSLIFTSHFMINPLSPIPKSLGRKCGFSLLAGLEFNFLYYPPVSVHSGCCIKNNIDWVV